MKEREAAAVGIEEVAALIADIDEVVRAAVKSASVRTSGGKDIDSWQVHSERVAYAATEVLAAKAMLEYAQAAAAAGTDAGVATDQAAVFAGEIGAKISGQFAAASADFDLPAGLFDKTLGSAATR